VANQISAAGQISEKIFLKISVSIPKNDIGRSLVHTICSIFQQVESCKWRSTSTCIRFTNAL